MVTEMTKFVAEKYPEAIESWNNSTMMARMGLPNELNGAVVYLMSKASSYTTGEDILVSGGMGQFC